LIAGTVFIALGVGIVLAALNVTYRDFRYIIPFLIQFWMFVTPVVYPASIVPERWRWALFINPMAGFIEGFRSAFLGQPLDRAGIAVSLTVSLTVFLVGIAYFERIERRFADVI
jgi:lipopolysaccharide transport system permease protein